MVPISSLINYEIIGKPTPTLHLLTVVDLRSRLFIDVKRAWAYLLLLYLSGHIGTGSRLR